MQTICGIDLGTQSCKLVVYDYEKKAIIAKSQTPVDIIADNDGTREQKTEWYDAVVKTCFDKIENDIKKTIAAIGVSGQQHGFVPLDGKGKPVYNVKLWCDTSTTKECEELTKCRWTAKESRSTISNSGATLPQQKNVKNLPRPPEEKRSLSPKRAFQCGTVTPLPKFCGLKNTNPPPSRNCGIFFCPTITSTFY